MPSHKITLGYSTGSENYSVTQTITDVQARAIDVTLAANTTNSEVDLVLTNADIDSLMLLSSSGDLTIKTNSTGSPGNTVLMTAGQEIIYCPSGSGIQAVGTNPFASANVTKLFLTTTAGTTFTLRAIVNANNG